MGEREETDLLDGEMRSEALGWGWPRPLGRVHKGASPRADLLNRSGVGMEGSPNLSLFPSVSYFLFSWRWTSWNLAGEAIWAHVLGRFTSLFLSSFFFLTQMIISPSKDYKINNKKNNQVAFKINIDCE